ncbi:hypothetical protein FQA39_LY18836 [Lamprigera yunnana]|nr:hypothetical protein FQA39_LY18836 [Lamprigera yunnana]
MVAVPRERGRLAADAREAGVVRGRTGSCAAPLTAFPFVRRRHTVLAALIAAELPVRSGRPGGRRYCCGFAAATRNDPVIDCCVQMLSLTMPTWSAVACYQTMLRTDLVDRIPRERLPVLQIFGAGGAGCSPPAVWRRGWPSTCRTAGCAPNRSRQLRSLPDAGSPGRIPPSTPRFVSRRPYEGRDDLALDPLVSCVDGCGDTAAAACPFHAVLGGVAVPAHHLAPPSEGDPFWPPRVALNLHHRGAGPRGIPPSPVPPRDQQHRVRPGSRIFPSPPPAARPSPTPHPRSKPLEAECSDPQVLEPYAPSYPSAVTATPVVKAGVAADTPAPPDCSPVEPRRSEAHPPDAASGRIPPPNASSDQPTIMSSPPNSGDQDSSQDGPTYRGTQ